MSPRSRLPLHWIGLSGIVVVLGATAIIGSHLINAAGRAPGRIETELLAQNKTATALGVVAAMEADRRAYQLTAMPEHLGALQHDHDRIHETLAELREAVATSPRLAPHVDSAEQVIGSWRDEVAAPGHRTPRGALEQDRVLLGAARMHLGHVGSVVDSELRFVRQGALDAQLDARRLWFVTIALTLMVIMALAQVAHRRQRRLQRSARETERLLEALPFAIVSLDPGGLVRHSTGLAMQLFGVPEVPVGERLVDRVASLDRPIVEQSLARAAVGGTATCEAQVRTEFDAVRVLSFSFSPILEQGRQVGVSAVVHDATTERAIRTQGLETERLARLGTMAAGVAHEVNGALTAIIGATALVDDDPLDPSSRGALATAQAEARRAARTVRIILDFSRRDAHRHEPQRIQDVLERALTLRRYDPRSHDVEFRLQTSADLPMVTGDAQELLQVFLNLLVNAEQAVRGQPQRRVTVEAHGENGRLLVSVADTGPGIPEEHLESVFEPFYTTKARGEGSGLGLALARGVVVEHQGAIWAERNVEGGARFIVALPAAPSWENLEVSETVSRSQPDRASRTAEVARACRPVAVAPPPPHGVKT